VEQLSAGARVQKKTVGSNPDEGGGGEGSPITKALDGAEERGTGGEGGSCGTEKRSSPAQTEQRGVGGLGVRGKNPSDDKKRTKKVYSEIRTRASHSDIEGETLERFCWEGGEGERKDISFCWGGKHPGKGKVDDTINNPGKREQKKGGGGNCPPYRRLPRSKKNLKQKTQKKNANRRN